MVCEDPQNCDEHIAFVNRVRSVRELVLALLSLCVSERKFSLVNYGYLRLICTWVT